MRGLDALADVRDLFLRMLPHRCPTGAIRIGHPARSSPVIATGNYALTVRRLRRVLAGRDVWLLVANSRGINVWCAAGGGHLTHHDFIAALRASRMDERVDRRVLIVPQLVATGVERRRIGDATGWDVRWGPADMADLPAYLDRGCRVHADERRVRFPLARRLEMAGAWGVWTTILVVLVGTLVGGWRLALAAGVGLLAPVVALYALMPWLRVAGPGRWPTFAGVAVAAAGIGAGLLVASGPRDAFSLSVAALLPAAAAMLTALDLAGTTPLFPSDVGAAAGALHIDLAVDRCTGEAECVQVCPRDVLAMNGRRRKVEIVRPGQCITCGACIVQCPEDALRFRDSRNRFVGADVIRTTHLNLLGRRVHTESWSPGPQGRSPGP